jgi:hypothetical protein
MNFSRRSFLSSLIASVIVGPQVFEEVAKGKSFISLYSPKIFIPSESNILALELARVGYSLPELFSRDDVFYKAIEATRDYPDKLTLTRNVRIPLIIQPRKIKL